MGYRSQVILAMKKEVYDKHIGILQPVLQDWDITITQTDTAYYFFWEDVKWYDNYPEIQAITGVINELNSEDFGFIRIGEEDEDIEQQGQPYAFEIYVNINIGRHAYEEEISNEEFFAPNSIKFIKDTK